jgi:anti-sigma-K factor RskA
MMDHDVWLERADIYALGALDGEELAQFEAHLAAGCPACEHRLRKTREALTLLPRSLTPAVPPAGVRARLLERVKAEVPRQPLEATHRRRRRWGVGLGALVAAGLLIGLGLELYRTRQELQRIDGVVSALRAELSRREGALRQAEERLASLQSELAQRDAQLEAARLQLQRAEAAVAELRAELAERDQTWRALASPQVRLVRLAGLPPSPGASGHLLWNAATRTGLLLTAGLPRLPRDRIYELWAIAGTEPIPAGTFGVDAAGHALVRLPPLPPVKRVTKFAVTLEPAGGVPKPSGPMLLVGSL